MAEEDWNKQPYGIPVVVFTTFILACFTWFLAVGVYNLTLHPLSRYPGPKLAAFTIWWKAYIELFGKRNLVDVLFDLHQLHGALFIVITGLSLT